MAMAFAHSMRALAADRGRWALAGLVAVLALLSAWGAWLVLARVTLYEVTRTARLEVAQAGHPIATPVAGRIVATHLVVGRDVQAGEVLVELDAAAVRLQHDEVRQWATALTAQRQARRQELVAEEAAQQAERQAAHTALAEARARQREAEVALQAATAQADVFARLQARGLAPQLDLLRTRAEADHKRAAADTLRLAVSRLEREQRTKDSDRTARLTQFHRELTRLDGELRTAEATLARLDHSIEQSRLRAPIAGRLGEVADIQPGAVVRQGDTLGVVLPIGALRVVAHFLPAVALGRVQPGQAARLRLEGFPWAQYGSLAAIVSSVAHEARNGMIRVELSLVPEALTTIPLQHGLPGTVEVEVERVSPATLILRGVGHRLGVSPRGAATAQSHEGVP
jgi:membrane fusion protein (multidrug efflux system)